MAGWAECGNEIFNRETGLSQLKFVTEKEKVIGRWCTHVRTSKQLNATEKVAIKLRVYTEIKGKKLDGWQRCCGLYGSSGGKAIKNHSVWQEELLAVFPRAEASLLPITGF